MTEQNSLLVFAQTKEEIEIVRHIHDSILVRNLEDMKPLLTAVAGWRAYIGIPKSDVKEELVINTNFIAEHYSHLTIDEIKLAYTLSITGKLDDVEFKGLFSPLYVAKVLNSYLFYRKKMLADALRRKEKHEQEQVEKAAKPSPEDQAKLTQELFFDFYKQYKETGEINDVFNICYNFLRNHKWLVISEEETNKAVLWGKNKAKEIMKRPNAISKFKIDEEKEEKRWARNYCVQNYFKIVDINILINKIKPELFA